MQAENRPPSHLDSISLLRDHLLPNLLKEDETEILYWAGKELARAYVFQSSDDLIEHMTTLFSGDLILSKATKHTVHYVWKGPLISHRLASQTAPSFSLEAGFLAEGFQQVNGVYTEATFDTDRRKSCVTFLLQSDSHVSLDA